jgi:predicted DNA-binding transcriptional regulator AlpA
VQAKLDANSNPTRVRLASSPEVADYLGVAVSTLAKWRWEGTGPPFERIGNRTVRYDWDEVVRWQESGQGGAG